MTSAYGLNVPLPTAQETTSIVLTVDSQQDDHN
jgi:hypothetical protein